MPLFRSSLAIIFFLLAWQPTSIASEGNCARAPLPTKHIELQEGLMTEVGDCYVKLSENSEALYAYVRDLFVNAVDYEYLIPKLESVNGRFWKQNLTSEQRAAFIEGVKTLIVQDQYIKYFAVAITDYKILQSAALQIDGRQHVTVRTRLWHDTNTEHSNTQATSYIWEFRQLEDGDGWMVYNAKDQSGTGFFHVLNKALTEAGDSGPLGILK